MAESLISVRTDRLRCPICGQLLKNPATVPCGHNFCMSCIQRRFDNDQRINRAFCCPECRQGFPSRPQLIRNTTLAEMVEESVCDSEKKRRKVSEETEVSLCWRHSCPLDVYCYTDELIICQLCATAQHRGHSFGVVKEERRRKQEEIKNMQMKIRRILQKHEEKEENEEKMLKQVEEAATQAVDYCEGVIVDVIASLQKHYESVRELIRARKEAAEAQVHLPTHQAKVEEMKKREAELDSLARTENNVDFLQKWTSLKPLCEKDLHTPFDEASEDPLLTFESTMGAVEKLGRRLEEFCDREFASVTQTGVWRCSHTAGEERRGCISQSPGPSEAGKAPVEEPKTREEFLQYACDLSLDYTTAHEDLAISEGGKEVMLRAQKCKSSPICSSQTFVHRRQVLCREGLEAERCYYEVEVKGDKVEIALAYKGIDRKSRNRLSAFGGNANSWSLDRSACYSVSHNADSVLLMAVPKHHKIGVYLKFKQGTLSFYEVSDSMRFLYRVEAEFTEPLYPGFWLGEKCCIRICDLTAQ